jgi:hypothetical protein
VAYLQAEIKQKKSKQLDDLRGQSFQQKLVAQVPKEK